MDYYEKKFNGGKSEKNNLLDYVDKLNISLFPQDVPTDKEVGSIKNGLSYGGAAFLGNEKAGGYGEFGFGLCQSGSFYMRNHITFGGGGLGSKTGFVEVGDKIIFGSHMNVTELFAVRTYALLGCGFAMFGGDPATGKSNLIKGGFMVYTTTWFRSRAYVWQ